MKRIIIFVGVLTGVMIAIGLFVMVTIHDEKIWLTTGQVVDEFGDQGLVLTRNATFNPVEYSANEVLPTIYDIEGSDYKMFIYEFADINQRDEWKDQDLYYGPSFDDDNWFSAFETKNIMLDLVVPINEILDHQTEIGALQDRITQIVRYNFNHAKKYRYEGSSEHWQGSMILEYYQDYLEDGENYYVEGEAIQTYEIEFLGEDYANIGPMSVEKELVDGGVETVTSDDLSLLDDDGWYRRVNKANSGFNIDKNDYEITFTWQGQKETVVLENTGIVSF